MARRGRPPHPELLTPREQEVLGHIRDGLSNDEIAGHLGISLDGVKYHVSEILGKLEVRNRREAARWRPVAEAKPWWSAAAAPLFFWRKVNLSALSPVIAGGLTVAVAAGIGLLVWALVATQGDGDSTQLFSAPVALPPGDKLAYIGTDGDLWVQEGEGPARRLTDSGSAVKPTWSPDGQWIAYVQSIEPASTSLWISDLQGEHRRLVSARWGLGRFEWSPDGSQIAYLLGNLPPGGNSLWVTNTSGFLSGLLPQDFGVRDFAWSPDGATLAVARSRPLVTQDPPAQAEDDGIYLVDVDSGEAEPLVLVSAITDQPSDAPYAELIDGVGQLRWSPDGRHLLFLGSSMRSVSLAADGLPLYSISVDGGPSAYHGTMLRSWALFAWRPDGEAFVFTLGGGRDLYLGKRLALAQPGVQGATVITDSTARSDAMPAISPDGERIAYQASERLADAILRLDVGKLEGPLEGIWSLRIDGSDPRQLTADPNYLDFYPQWSAGGELIMFVRTDGQPFREDGADLPGSHADVWLMRPDGSDAIPLVTNLKRISSYYGLFTWEDYLDWHRAPVD